jgi:hypothetical protein
MSRIAAGVVVTAIRQRQPGQLLDELARAGVGVPQLARRRRHLLVPGVEHDDGSFLVGESVHLGTSPLVALHPSWLVMTLTAAYCFVMLTCHVGMAGVFVMDVGQLKAGVTVVENGCGHV